MKEGFDEASKNRESITGAIPEKFVPGQVIAGKFKVISRLGSGGMGTVYRVEQIFLKKEFALKTMDHSTGSEVMIQRFQLEAKAAFSLKHPNLVKVHDFGILDNGNPYLVMDFINGVTFAEYLKEHGPLPIASVAPLFVQACFGLMAAHEQSVVHRDIKPANLMLLNGVALEKEGSVKVVDFGIAKLVNREDGEIQALTRTGEIFGSPLYMSPEQCSSGTVDHRSDIYSLGCVLFEMLTGTPPHTGQNAMKTMLLHQAGETPTLKEASLGHDFPESLERIVAKMLRKFPEQRYQNIGQVTHDLTMFGSENQSKSSVKPSRAMQKAEFAAPKMVSMTSTRFYALLAVTGFFAATIAGLAVYIINNQPPGPPSPPPSPVAPAAQTLPKAPPAADYKQIALSNDLYMSKEEGADIEKSRTKANAKLLEQLGPIQEVDVIVDKKKQHKYQFPEICLGDIEKVGEHNYGELVAKAKGVVYLPVDQPFGLKMRGPEAIAMIMSPSIFKKLPPKTFHILTFGIPTDGRTAKAMPEELTQSKMQECVATALKNLDGWPNLEGLTLESCILNDNAIVAINNIKKIRTLTLEQCTLDPEFLATQPFLSNLEGCRIEKCAFASDPIVNRLGGSSALRTLSVDGAISTANLHQLRRCPKLSVIQIKASQIDDKSIEEICAMKKLKELRLFHMRLTDEQLNKLTTCPSPKKIILSGSIYGDRVGKVKALDPRIDFE